MEIGERYYEMFLDTETGKYYVVLCGIITFVGTVSLDNKNIDVSIEECLANYLSYRNYAIAIELAALGHWKESRSFVSHNWELIVSAIDDSDIRSHVHV
jgi:hypothetical protein